MRREQEPGPALLLEGEPMRRLPPALHPHSPAEKLAWLHIHANPGEHSARQMADELGGSPRTWAQAIAALLRAGLLREDEPAAGPKPGKYTAQREAVARGQ